MRRLQLQLYEYLLWLVSFGYDTYPWDARLDRFHYIPNRWKHISRSLTLLLALTRSESFGSLMDLLLQARG